MKHETTLTVKECLEMSKGLKALESAKIGMPFTLALRLKKNLSEIEHTVELYNSSKRDLIMELGEEDDKGMVTVLPENTKEFLESLHRIEMERNEYDLYHFHEADFPQHESDIWFQVLGAMFSIVHDDEGIEELANTPEKLREEDQQPNLN